MHVIMCSFAFFPTGQYSLMANFMDFAIVDWWISYSCITKYIYSWNRGNIMKSFTKFSGNWVCHFIQTLTMNFFLYWGRWWLEQEIIVLSVIWDQRTWLRDGWDALFVFLFAKQIDFKSWVQNTGSRGVLANKIIFLKYSPCCQGSLNILAGLLPSSANLTKLFIWWQ